jgi:predicted RNA-binding protein with RPS1 domain
MAERYPVGTRVKGTVTSVTDFGVFLEIEEGIEGLIHVSQLSSEHVDKPQALFQPGQEVEAEVTNIDGRERKIALSIKALRRSEEKEEMESYLRREREGARFSFEDIVPQELRLDRDRGGGRTVAAKLSGGGHDEARLIQEVVRLYPRFSRHDASHGEGRFRGMTDAPPGERIEIRGFGSFVKHRQAREGRNPKTGRVVKSLPSAFRSSRSKRELKLGSTDRRTIERDPDSEPTAAAQPGDHEGPLGAVAAAASAVSTAPGYLLPRRDSVAAPRSSSGRAPEAVVISGNVISHATGHLLVARAFTAIRQLDERILRRWAKRSAPCRSR